MTWSMAVTKILPSPILPVPAACWMASMTASSRSSVTTVSILILGRKSTTYSAPRYSSVWPYCRSKPFTSVTVMPDTPACDKDSRTSSSLNGRMMAVISFMRIPRWWMEPADRSRPAVSRHPCARPPGGVHVIGAERCMNRTRARRDRLRRERMTWEGAAVHGPLLCFPSCSVGAISRNRRRVLPRFPNRADASQRDAYERVRRWRRVGGEIRRHRRENSARCRCGAEDRCLALRVHGDVRVRPHQLA